MPIDTDIFTAKRVAFAVDLLERKYGTGFAPEDFSIDHIPPRLVSLGTIIFLKAQLDMGYYNPRSHLVSLITHATGLHDTEVALPNAHYEITEILDAFYTTRPDARSDFGFMQIGAHAGRMDYALQFTLIPKMDWREYVIGWFWRYYRGLNPKQKLPQRPEGA